MSWVQPEPYQPPQQPYPPPTYGAPPPPGGPTVIVQQQQMQGPRRRPVGVTVVSVLYLIGAIFLGFAAIIFFVMGALGSAFADQASGEIAELIASFGVVLGLLILLLAGLVAWVGIGNLRGKGWAWTAIIVLTIIGLAGQVMSLVGATVDAIASTIVSLAIGGLILWYYFTAPVKAYFGKGSTRPM